MAWAGRQCRWLPRKNARAGGEPCRACAGHAGRIRGRGADGRRRTCDAAYPRGDGRGAGVAEAGTMTRILPVGLAMLAPLLAPTLAGAQTQQAPIVATPLPLLPPPERNPPG